jgi:RNA polymerase sigma factor (sigma-70 family)
MRTEDGYIVNKCINGDSAAFGLLVDKYKASIYALAYSRLRNFHDAEDITQEVFLKAYQKLPTLRRWDSFLAWLYAITSNLCRDLLREQAKRPDGDFITDKGWRFFDYPSINSYQEEQLYESLHEALDSLPEMYREVLTLYYLGGMDSKEIAQFLGTSPSAIRQRLRRARSKLKKEMLDMMSKTYDQQRLQPSFTFRIVEMVKRIKIKPAPSQPLLPLGLSAATGIVLTVLMFSPHLISLTPLGALLSSPLPSETKVEQVGELPVDVLKISEITFLSSQQGDSNDSVPKLANPQNALAPPLAPPDGTGKWMPGIDMPTARYSMSAAVVDGNIYVVGGWNKAQGCLKTVEMYDPILNTWQPRADVSQGDIGVAVAAVNGKIYAMGGGWCGGNLFHTVEEYDPVADNWTRKADIPTARNWISAAVVDGIIYAIGGGTSVVEAYDAVADKWTRKANLPLSSNCRTAVVEGKIYAMGFLGDNKPISNMYEYDPMNDNWMRKTDMPTARASLSVVAVGGKIYAMGGMSIFPQKVAVVEVYDPRTDTWERGVDLPIPRAVDVSAVVEGKIYLIGGVDVWTNINGPPDSVLSTVEVFDTGFSISPQSKLPTTWGRMKSE